MSASDTRLFICKVQVGVPLLFIAPNCKSEVGDINLSPVTADRPAVAPYCLSLRHLKFKDELSDQLSMAAAADQMSLTICSSIENPNWLKALNVYCKLT